jgi:hypothetical protein
VRGLAHLGDFAHWGSTELCWVWLGLACSRRYIACFAVVGGEFNLLLFSFLFFFHHVIYAWNCLGKFKFSFGSLEEFDFYFSFKFLFIYLFFYRVL